MASISDLSWVDLSWVDLTEAQKEELVNRFSYHKPNAAGVSTHAKLSEAFVAIASVVVALVPSGREQALALTNLEQAKFWASAGVARNPKYSD